MADEKKDLRPQPERAAESAANGRADDSRRESADEKLDRELAERRNDKDFQELLARIIEEDREILDELASR